MENYIYYLVFTDAQNFRLYCDTQETRDLVVKNENWYVTHNIPDKYQKNFDLDNFDISLGENKELIIREKESEKPKEPTFEENQKQKLNDAYQYGNSTEVDANLINGTPIVISADVRTKIRERLEIAQINEQTTDTIRLGNISVSLPLEQIHQLLTQISKRAIANYDNLQQHLAQIQAIKDQQNLDNYDFKTGYQKPLEFNL